MRSIEEAPFSLQHFVFEHITEAHVKMVAAFYQFGDAEEFCGDRNDVFIMSKEPVECTDQKECTLPPSGTSKLAARATVSRASKLMQERT